MKSYGKVYCLCGEMVKLTNENLDNMYWLMDLETGKSCPKLSRCEKCEGKEIKR